MVTALVVMALSSVAHATAPSWRGSEGSTYQKWTFDSDAASQVSPEVVSNPYGAPTADVVLGEFGEPGWLPDLPASGSQTGFWNIGTLGTISFHLPNSPFNGGYKELWISVVSFNIDDIQPAPTVNVVSGGVVSFLGEETYLVEQVDGMSAWNGHLTKWLIVPNPNSEQVVITGDMFGGSVVDQVEIDTRCVPEPASFAALLMGGSFLLALRRRKA